MNKHEYYERTRIKTITELLDDDASYRIYWKYKQLSYIELYYKNDAELTE
jgi:hypothetical protein